MLLYFTLEYLMVQILSGSVAAGPISYADANASCKFCINLFLFIFLIIYGQKEHAEQYPCPGLSAYDAPKGAKLKKPRATKMLHKAGRMVKNEPTETRQNLGGRR
jgi:hypothetical protein